MKLTLVALLCATVPMNDGPPTNALHPPSTVLSKSGITGTVPTNVPSALWMGTLVAPGT